MGIRVNVGNENVNSLIQSYRNIMVKTIITIENNVDKKLSLQ